MSHRLTYEELSPEDKAIVDRHRRYLNTLPDERDKLIIALRAKMKVFFVAAEFQEVDKLMQGSEEMFAEIGGVVAERIKALAADNKNLRSAFEV